MRNLVAFCAMTSLIGKPLSAAVRDAAFVSSADRPTAQTSMFVGASYRLSLGGHKSQSRSRASLKIAGMSATTDSSSIRLGDGLELAEGNAGRPTVYLAGRDVSQMNKRANISDGGKVALAVTGLVVIVGVVAALVIADRLNDDDED